METAAVAPATFFAMVDPINVAAVFAASQLHRILGLTGMQLVRRIPSILLTAPAVQFIVDGIIQSRIFVVTALG